MEFLTLTAVLLLAAYLQKTRQQKKHVLLLAGFFEDQLRRRHNLRWYAHLGVGFFSRAASLARSPGKVRLLAAIAAGFEPWRQRHARLSRELREEPYLLIRPQRRT